LYRFDEAILKTFLGQSQQSTVANREETKDQNNKQSENNKSENVNLGKAVTDSASSLTTNNEENKSETLPQENAPSSDKKQETSSQNTQDTQYLFFDADEFLITTYQNESGWWCGYKDTGDGGSAQNLGYFPSNFVQVIEVYEVPTIVNAEGTEENANMDEAFTWNDYAKYSYLNDDQILVQERTKTLNDFRAPEHRNQEGILGYKKIKIHESRSHALNPAKGGKVITSQVAIKDQSPVSKAYRQMNHYFDYDAWIEQRNMNPQAKAKADPSKKKTKKKTLDW